MFSCWRKFSCDLLTKSFVGFMHENRTRHYLGWQLEVQSRLMSSQLGKDNLNLDHITNSFCLFQEKNLKKKTCKGDLLFNEKCRPITGASMNPGRSIGAAIAAGAYKNLWVYIVAPVLGSLAAVLVYCLLRLPESEKEETSTNVNHKDFYFHHDL